MVELPDNVKPNLGRDTVVSLPRDTEKSKLSIIKATVGTKSIAKKRKNAVSDVRDGAKENSPDQTSDTFTLDPPQIRFEITTNGRSALDWSFHTQSLSRTTRQQEVSDILSLETRAKGGDDRTGYGGGTGRRVGSMCQQESGNVDLGRHHRSFTDDWRYYQVRSQSG